LLVHDVHYRLDAHHRRRARSGDRAHLLHVGQEGLEATLTPNSSLVDLLVVSEVGFTSCLEKQFASRLSTFGNSVAEHDRRLHDQDDVGATRAEARCLVSKPLPLRECFVRSSEGGAHDINAEKSGHSARASS
jgi:hypothetical protein